jgi:transcriptional regulator with XRE-family HTH domain
VKGLKQSQLAKELGISKSYLSMILSGQRKCPPELVGKLQSIPEVHKVVNFQLQEVPSKQRVVGSNPSRDATQLNRAKEFEVMKLQDALVAYRIYARVKVTIL